LTPYLLIQYPVRKRLAIAGWGKVGESRYGGQMSEDREGRVAEREETVAEDIIDVVDRCIKRVDKRQT
jgi:hypothetical protein